VIFAGSQSRQPVGMAEVSPEGRFIRVNRAFATIVGRAVEEVTGMSFEDITYPDDLPADRVVFESLWAGRDPTVKKQKRYLKADGSVAWVQLASAVVHDADGEPSYALTVFQDVTAQKRLEAELTQAQKLDAVGRLAGGIAHDFNNLLTAIIGYADLLSHMVADNPRVQEDAGAIIATARRGADLARNLLTLSRRSPERTERVDLNAVAREVEALTSRTFDRRIAVLLDLAPDTPILSGDRSLLTNALLNLALNARDAMPEGGHLRVETADVVLNGRFAARTPDVIQGLYVALSVTDTGPGIPHEALPHLFEPFGQAAHGHIGDAEVGEDRGRGVDLRAAAVDHHKLRWVREFARPAVVLRLFLGQIAVEATPDDLADRRHVIGGTLDDKAPIVALSGDTVFEDHHAGHHVGALNLGDVKAFDA